MLEPTGKIILGDAHELSKLIAPGSVDLILTDPIYDQYGDYAFLRDLAQTVLAPKGNLLAFVNAKHFWKASAALQPNMPPLAYVQSSGPSPMNGKIIAKTYYLLWWGHRKLVNYMPDGYVGTTWSAPGKHFHKWTKNPKYVSRVIDAFTADDGLVLDSFCGSGTIPLVCKQMGRRFIAFERDEDLILSANERLEQMPVARRLWL